MYKRGLVTPAKLKSDSLARPVKLGVYLPEHYSALHEHAVIIAFDGQDFSQLGQLHRQYESLAEEHIRSCIIIFVHYPDIETRATEYHPDSSAKQQMIQFVTIELEGWLKENFAVTNERILMGDSLAASIALSIALIDPRFSRAALFSPMVTETTFKELDTLSHPVRFFHRVGLGEIEFKLMNGETADFLTPNRELNSAFEAEGIPHDYMELTGGHTWQTWKPGIAYALKYFLGE